MIPRVVNACPLFKEENCYHNLLGWYFSIKATYDLYCKICKKNILESGCTHKDLTAINYQINHVAIVPNPESEGTGLVFDGGYKLKWITRKKNELEKIKSGELEIFCHYCTSYNLDHSKLSIKDWIDHQQLEHKYIENIIQTGYL